MKRSYLLLLIFLSSRALLATEPDSVFYSLFRADIGGWIAADATYSIFLPDGRTLWLFGDTFIGSVDDNNAIVPGAKFIRNSAVIQDGQDLQTLIEGTRSAPDDFIPSEYPDSIWYWPEHGIVENDTLRIIVSKFGTDPDGVPGWNFVQLGSAIASYSWPGLDYINKTDLLAEEQNGVIYGDRLLPDQGYLYIYGRRNDDPEVNIAYPHVARVPEGELMAQQWEFYDGSGWSTDPAATKRMSTAPVSQQYSVSYYKGKYVLLTQDIWLSPKIYTYTSVSPSGPWENKKLIYTTPESGGSTFTYNAYAHPQFDRDNELLMSYNVNGDFASIFTNVELYRPRFMRVSYMAVDYQFWPNALPERESQADSHIRLFPNPASGVVNLEFSVQDAAILHLRLTDLSGRTVLAPVDHLLDSGLQTVRLNTTGLPSACYLLHLEYGESRKTLPLIVTTNTTIN